MTTNEMITYDMMIEYHIATAEEINLVANIMGGTWENIFDAITYARTGYNTWDQYLTAEMEEE